MRFGAESKIEFMMRDIGLYNPRLDTGKSKKVSRRYADMAGLRPGRSDGDGADSL
jgi:hypothetical protein